MDGPGLFGSGPIFGTPESFRQYHVRGLLERSSGAPTDDRRLILFGHGNFRARHEKLHAWMAERGVKHLNVDGPTRPHVWSSGWLPEAFDLILTDLPPAPKPNE